MKAILLPLLVSSAVAQTRMFGTSSPRALMNKYLWGSTPVAPWELRADLDTLRQGAEQGWAVDPCGGESSCTALADARGTGLWDRWSSTVDKFNDMLALEKSQDEQLRELREQQERMDALLEQQKEQMMQQERQMEQQKRQLEEQGVRLQEQQRQQQQRQEEFDRQRRILEQQIAEQRRQVEEQERLLREAQQRQEQERRRLFSFSAAGDPRLCPLDEQGTAIEEFCIEYKGPATFTCFDQHGSIQSIDFVGVSYEDGSNPQAKDAYWVAEQWRVLPPSFQEFKYRNVTGQKVADVSCANDWLSEALPSSQPPPEWLSAFNGGRSFALHDLQPRIADGPPFEVIWKMLMDKKSMAGAEFEHEHVGRWVNAMLMMLGYASEHNHKGSALDLIAKYALFYGIAAHAKAPPKQLA